MLRRIAASPCNPAQFIVDSVNISGNGSLTVQYNANQLYSASNLSLLE
jgi:hypothetical protein